MSAEKHREAQYLPRTPPSSLAERDLAIPLPSKKRPTEKSTKSHLNRHVSLHWSGGRPVTLAVTMSPQKSSKPQPRDSQTKIISTHLTASNNSGLRQQEPWSGISDPF